MKKVLATGLTAALLLTAASCGSTGGGPTTGNTTTGPQNTETDAPGTSQGTDSGTTPDNLAVGVIEDGWTLPEEPVELIWLNGGTVPPDLEAVEAKLDEITLDKLNVKVHTLFLDDQGVKLHINSGQDWDLAYTCDWYNNYGEQVRNGAFADITDKVESLVPTLYSSIPELVWDGIKIDGKIYGVPILKDYAAEMFWQLDADLMDDLGMEVPYSLDEYGDIEPYLEAIHEAIQSGNPLTENYDYVFTRTPLGTDSAFERISSPAAIGIPFSAKGTDKAHEIVFIWSHEDYMNRLEYLHDWYQKGYMSPEILTQTEIPKYSGAKANQGFYGADAIWSAQDGYRQYIARYNGPTISTSTVTNLTALNPNSDNIDLALMYTQFANTDQRYRDILRYGVEGTHFTYTDTGLVARDPEKSPNYMPWGFAQASYALNSVETVEGVTVDPDMWKKIFEIYEEEAVASDALGFSFNPKPVEAQIVAVSTVISKYNVGLNAGYMDPAETVPQLEAEAMAAGLQEILDEAQAQLDAFLKGKGIEPKHG